MACGDDDVAAGGRAIRHALQGPIACVNDDFIIPNKRNVSRGASRMSTLCKDGVRARCWRFVLPTIEHAI